MHGPERSTAFGNCRLNVGRPKLGAKRSIRNQSATPAAQPLAQATEIIAAEPAGNVDALTDGIEAGTVFASIVREDRPAVDGLCSTGHKRPLTGTKQSRDTVVMVI